MIRVGDEVHASEYGVGTVQAHGDFMSEVNFKLSGLTKTVPDYDLVVLAGSVHRTGRSQDVRLLELLTLAKAQGYTRTKLMEMGFGNPNAVVMKLRKLGHKVNTIRETQGSCRYVLEA